MLYALARPLLFSLDPETAHSLTLALADAPLRFGLWRGPRVPVHPVRVMGLEFPNPVGLAAGLDKNAEHIDALGALGFGFLEVGTVTPRPQPGNPRPRMFRLPAANALINRLGFNNVGLEVFLQNRRRASWRGVLGINIGKNFDTPNERAADDYVKGLEGVYAHASYVTVNVSSPNTTGLRDLQHKAALEALLERLLQSRAALADRHGRQIPLVLKVSPDLSGAEISEIAEAVRRKRIDALIATNTSLTREGVERQPHASESGGLSGAPILRRSTSVLAAFAKELKGEVALIGAGGIVSGSDAAEKIDAGASLVQLYTGLVYRGPNLIAECASAIARAERAAA